MSKTYNTSHSCHNFPVGSRQAARGARICKTNLFIDRYMVFKWVLPIALKHLGDTLEWYHIWEGMEGMNYQVRWQQKPDDIPFELKVENILHAVCN